MKKMHTLFSKIITLLVNLLYSIQEWDNEIASLTWQTLYPTSVKRWRVWMFKNLIYGSDVDVENLRCRLSLGVLLLTVYAREWQVCSLGLWYKHPEKLINCSHICWVKHRTDIFLAKTKRNSDSQSINVYLGTFQRK